MNENTEDIETHEVDGLTVSLVPDLDPQSPREWSNLGVMACFHPRYMLGDEDHGLRPSDFPGEEEFIAHIREEFDPTVILPLYLLDHSGLVMRAGEDVGEPKAGQFVSDPQGWDTSHVGFIFDSAETRKEMEVERDDPKIREYLESEVETYSTYLEGGACGYVVTDENGETLDSCWGFYELRDAREQGLDAAKHEAESRKLGEGQYGLLAASVVELVKIEERLEDADLDTLAGYVRETAKKLSKRMEADRATT